MKNVIAGFQWMAFMVAGSIVAPIAIAGLFGLNAEESAGFVQRTLFIVGVSGLLQGLFGHRLPINEGPAGLWWGVFVLYGELSTALFSSETETLMALQGAMIVSGIVFMILALGNFIDKLANLFTPVVLGIYLLLLVFQLSGSFIRGMLGVGYRKEGIDIPVALFSLALVLLTFWFSHHKKRMINQYSVLLSLGIGWFFFYLLGFMRPVEQKIHSFIKVPELLAFGNPVFDSGMGITAIFVTVLLLTNMVASIQLVDKVRNVNTNERADKQSLYKRSGFVAGINHILSGIFSAVGSVPISGAAGFIATIKNARMIPFLIGSLLVIGASFSPHMMAFIASLPMPVGYSVMFVVFANMIGMAFSEFDKEKDKVRIRLVIGLSLLGGVGIMFVPSEAYAGLPPALTSVISNGLIVGSLIAIVLDQWTKQGAKRRTEGKNKEKKKTSRK